MRCIAGIFLAFLTGMCMAATPSPDDEDECGYRRARDGTVFALTIERSFAFPVMFLLCQREAPGQSFVLVSIGGDDPEMPVETKIQLEEPAYQNLVKLYDAALDYDVKDDTVGLDGSGWCLETRRGFTYSKACFWSPGNKTETRGLTGLYNLATALWMMANLEQSGGSLY